MAMIERIRQRRGLLIFFIGLGMLGFLIPYDAVMGLFGKAPGSESIGELNGSSMSRAEWQEELKKVNDTGLYAGGARDVESAAWSDLTNTILYGEEFSAAGYTVGDDEYENLRFGIKPSAMVVQAYYRGTVNEENRELARNLFEQQSGLREVRQKEMIIKRYKLEKLESLLKKGLYANSLDAEREYLMKNDKSKVDFVAIKYDAISDSLVDVSESKILSYFNKNKNDVKYRQNPFRTINYITYDVQASSADSTRLKNDLSVIEEAFKTAENDSIFVIRNSNDRKFLKETYIPGSAAGSIDRQLVDGAVGTIVGPYRDKNTFKLSKVIAKAPVVTEVEGRHIFLKAGFREKDSVRVVADSIKQMLVNGASFRALAQEFSADDSTANNAGKLGSFSADVELDPSKSALNALKNLLMASKQNDVKIADIPGGISIYEATSLEFDGENSILAVVSRPILPSEDTKNEIYEEVRTFAYEHSNGTELIEEAEAKGLTVNEQRITPTTRNISSIQNSEEISNWANARDTEVGKVSQIFTIGNQFIVAALTAAQDEVVPNYDTVKEDVKTDAIKQAKYDLVASKMNDGSLEEILAKVDGAEKKTVTANFNTSNITGLGNNESEAVGYAFGAPSGTITRPIKGDAGVVVLEIKEGTLAELKTNYPDEQTTLQTSFSGKYNRIRGSLTKTMIKDERNRF